jgi:hypothetical protein
MSKHVWGYICDEYYHPISGVRLARYKCERCGEEASLYPDPNGHLSSDDPIVWKEDCDEATVKRVMEE